MLRIRIDLACARAAALPAVALVLAALALDARPAGAASPYLGEIDRGTQAVLIDTVAPAETIVLTPEPFLLAAGPKRAERPEHVPVAPVAPVPPVAPVAPVAPVPPVAPVAPTAPLALLPRLRLPSDAWYGVSLRCSDCTIEREDDTDEFEWRFRSAPEIIGLEPDSPADKAGVRRGDVLTHIDGKRITSREAGRRFSSAKPGESLRWTVRLGNKTRDVTVVAGKRSEQTARSFAALQDELQEAQKEFVELREKLGDLKIDKERLEALHASEARLADVARALADLERQRGVIAPRGLYVLPEGLLDSGGVVVLPDDDKIRIVDRDRHVIRDDRRLRYTGEIGNSHVEVHGSSAVVVTEEKNGDLVIDTPDASIRVQQKRN